MKQRINISLDKEIVVDLKSLAANDHKNVSQWITDKVVETKRQQMSLNYHMVQDEKKEHIE